MSYDAKAAMDLATLSAKQQIELSKTSLDNQLDAADRIIARKAADTVLEVAKSISADPTT